jgi:hypothetical protein
VAALKMTTIEWAKKGLKSHNLDACDWLRWDYDNGPGSSSSCSSFIYSQLTLISKELIVPALAEQFFPVSGGS